MWEERNSAGNGRYTKKLQTVETGKNEDLDEGYINMSIINWKVLSIDKITGKVKLVPSEIPEVTLKLMGAIGYNNAVNLLDNACNSLYGTENISARSIDIDDIEEVLNIAAVDADFDEKIDWVTKKGEFKQVETAYAVERSYYPVIYAQEKWSVINGVKRNSGLDLSSPTQSLIEYGEEQTKVAETNIQPYKTYYYFNYSDFTSYLGSLYSEILLPNGDLSSYWVASRCGFGDWSGYNFKIRKVVNGTLGALDMFGSWLNTWMGRRLLFFQLFL